MAATKIRLLQIDGVILAGGSYLKLFLRYNGKDIWHTPYPQQSLMNYRVEQVCDDTNDRIARGKKKIRRLKEKTPRDIEINGFIDGLVKHGSIYRCDSWMAVSIMFKKNEVHIRKDSQRDSAVRIDRKIDKGRLCELLFG